MGTLQAVRNLKRIVEAERTPVIVVVSALKTVTNNLVKATGLASRGDGQYRDVLEEVVAPEEKCDVELTLDTRLLPDYGLTQGAVYLSRFAGDKVGDDNEIPITIDNTNLTLLK